MVRRLAAEEKLLRRIHPTPLVLIVESSARRYMGGMVHFLAVFGLLGLCILVAPLVWETFCRGLVTVVYPALKWSIVGAIAVGLIYQTQPYGAVIAGAALFVASCVYVAWPWIDRKQAQKRDAAKWAMVYAEIEAMKRGEPVTDSLALARAAARSAR